MYNPKPAADPHFRFPLQCHWLKLNGSWPLQSRTWSSNPGSVLYTSWSWCVIACVAITIYFQSAFLVYIFGDIAQTTENCCTTFMGVLNFVRLLHLRLHQPQFRRIIAQFVAEIWIARNSHPAIERECERNMRIFRTISLLLTCLISLYCVMPLIELAVGHDGDEGAAQPFPYKMLFPYDALHGWRYVLTYIFTAFAGVCVVTTLFAEDSLFGLFITYTCGQFGVLHQRIDELAADAHASVTQRTINVPPDHGTIERAYQGECLRRLMRIAFRHNKLVEFARCLEDFFSPIMLVNFVISSILICMVGFQLATGKNMFIGDYVKFLVYISSSLSQLFVLCYNGDMLIQYAADTGKHLYACNWEGGSIAQTLITTTEQQSRRLVYYYSAGKTFQSNLEVMIMFSQRQVRITALKFSTLSLQTFSTLISTSMSYFALLKSFYEDDAN